MVEGSVVFDPVDRALPLLDEFCGFDLRADGELPVRAGLALRDDVLGLLPVGDDLARDLEPLGTLGRRHHPDAAKRVVHVVGEQGHRLGYVHPRHVHHDGARPAEEAHLPARIGEALHARLLPAGCGGDLKKFTRCLHRLPFRSVRARRLAPKARVRP